MPRAGCMNRACSVSWPEVVKGITNQGVFCFVSSGSFFCFSFVFRVCMWCFVSLLLAVSIPVQSIACKESSPTCVEWDLKPYTLIHSRLKSHKLVSITGAVHSRACLWLRSIVNRCFIKG